ATPLAREHQLSGAQGRWRHAASQVDGEGLMRKLVLSLATAGALAFGSAGSLQASEGAGLVKHDWSFNGVFGTFDRGALQRGYEVYRQVCASCHAMDLLAFRNLTEIGLSEDQVKEI